MGVDGDGQAADGAGHRQTPEGSPSPVRGPEVDAKAVGGSLPGDVRSFAVTDDGGNRRPGDGDEHERKNHPGRVVLESTW